MRKIITTVRNNPFEANLWGAFGIACLVGVLIKGAWWHLATVCICYAMYKAFGGK